MRQPIQNGRNWNRQELLVALRLYCLIPFGKLHSRNPDIVACAQALGRTASALAMKLTNIASLDPTITSTGRKGLNRASQADRDAWNEMNADWDQFVVESENVLARIGCQKFLDKCPSRSCDPIEQDMDHVDTDRIAQTRARIGQDFFRRSVLSAYNNKCCITGLAVPTLLVASHIVPWAVDRMNRLNPRNGLALSALHDKAFDLGLITVNDDLTIRVSKGIMTRKDEFCAKAIKAFHGEPVFLPEKFRPEEEFLAYHRRNIFVG